MAALGWDRIADLVIFFRNEAPSFALLRCILLQLKFDFYAIKY